MPLSTGQRTAWSPPGRRAARSRGDDAACPSRPGRTACRRCPVRPAADPWRDASRAGVAAWGRSAPRSSTCRNAGRGASWRTAGAWWTLGRAGRISPVGRKPAAWPARRGGVAEGGVARLGPRRRRFPARPLARAGPVERSAWPGPSGGLCRPSPTGTAGRRRAL